MDSTEMVQIDFQTALKIIYGGVDAVLKYLESPNPNNNLEDIVASIFKTNEITIQTVYKLTTGQSVEFLTAMIVFLVQAFLENVNDKSTFNEIKEHHRQIDALIDKFLDFAWSKYTAENFKKYLNDIIKLAAVPEWPAAFIILKHLKQTLAKIIMNEAVDKTIVIQSLEYFTTITTHCQRENKWFEENVELIDRAISDFNQTKNQKDTMDRIKLARAYLLDYLEMDNPCLGHVWKLDWLIENGNKEAETKMNLKESYHKRDILELLTRYLVSNSLSTINIQTILYRQKCLIAQVRVLVYKCLARLLEADPNLQENAYVKNCLFIEDPIPCVNEARVIVIGKIVSRDPSLSSKYKTVLFEKIDDGSVNIRKRAMEFFASFEKFPEKVQAYSKILGRIVDVDYSVRKFVVRTFKSIWFMEKNNNCFFEMVEVISLASDQGNFETLLINLLQPRYNILPSKVIFTASKETLVNLMHSILWHTTFDEDNQDKKKLTVMTNMVYYFAKVSPRLLKKHVKSLIELLGLSKIHDVIHNLSETLKLLIPLIKIPISLLRSLECNLFKLINDRDSEIVGSCFDLLAGVVQLTRNYQSVENCFLFHNLQLWSIGDEMNLEALYRHRRIFIVFGYLLRYFDVRHYVNLPNYIKENVITVLFFALEVDYVTIQILALEILQNICLRYSNMLLLGRLKNAYLTILNYNLMDPLKLMVLNNIETCLKEKKKKIAEANWLNLLNVVLLTYRNSILKCCNHANADIRRAAYKIVELSLNNHVFTAQDLPYLICMAADSNLAISQSAKNHLFVFNNRFPELIETHSLEGLKLSYQLQASIYNGIIRGVNGRKAVNSYLYFLCPKPSRRFLIENILEQFESEQNLQFLLFLTDNLSNFPYSTLEEPVFLVGILDSKIPILESKALEEFEKNLLQDRGDLLQRIPDDTSCLTEAFLKIHCCTLMINLKNYLQNLYDLPNCDCNDIARRKNWKYFTPTEVIRALEEPQAPKEILFARYCSAMVQYEIDLTEVLKPRKRQIRGDNLKSKKSKKAQSVSSTEAKE